MFALLASQQSGYGPDGPSPKLYIYASPRLG